MAGGRPVTDDEIAEVLTNVEAALRGELRPVGLPMHSALAPEWRVMVHFRAGGSAPYDCADEAEALERAARLRPGGWELQRRLVSEWQSVPAPPGHGARPHEGGD